MTYTYKNTASIPLRFRAAKTAENPSIKAVYEVKVGETITVPVKCSHPDLTKVKAEKQKGEK